MIMQLDLNQHPDWSRSWFMLKQRGGAPTHVVIDADECSSCDGDGAAANVQRGYWLTGSDVMDQRFVPPGDTPFESVPNPNIVMVFDIFNTKEVEIILPTTLPDIDLWSCPFSSGSRIIRLLSIIV